MGLPQEECHTYVSATERTVTQPLCADTLLLPLLQPRSHAGHPSPLEECFHSDPSTSLGYPLAVQRSALSLLSRPPVPLRRAPLCRVVGVAVVARLTTEPPPSDGAYGEVVLFHKGTQTEGTPICTIDV